MILLCKGTCAPVAPFPFKGQGGSAAVTHPRFGFPVLFVSTFVLINSSRLRNLLSR